MLYFIKLGPGRFMCVCALNIKISVISTNTGTIQRKIQVR